MQQFLTVDDPTTVNIAIDHRESKMFDKLLKDMGAHVQRAQLPVADFICSARLAVERKSRADFEQSIIDGRLFSQLSDLKKNYESAIVIVEGKEEESRIGRNAILGAFASIMSDYGASLFFTSTAEATAELVFHFAKHEQLAKKQVLRIYAKRRTLTASQTSRSIIEALPTVGPKLARSLLIHFGNIQNIIAASERELCEVQGLGKKRAKIIKKSILYHYDEEEDSS